MFKLKWKDPEKEKPEEGKYLLVDFGEDQRHHSYKYSVRRYDEKIEGQGKLEASDGLRIPYDIIERWAYIEPPK